jgi:hypothetical protein
MVTDDFNRNDMVSGETNIHGLRRVIYGSGGLLYRSQSFPGGL